MENLDFRCGDERVSKVGARTFIFIVKERGGGRRAREVKRNVGFWGEVRGEWRRVLEFL